jgi:hypothetical protein
MTEDELKAIEAAVTRRTVLGGSSDMDNYFAWQETVRSLANVVPALLAEVRRLRSEPRYSNEAVDALLSALDEFDLTDGLTKDLVVAADAVSASREPKP